jgi:hypothetical protein
MAGSSSTKKEKQLPEEASLRGVVSGRGLSWLSRYGKSHAAEQRENAQ